MESVKNNCETTPECLYLAGVTLKPEFRHSGLGVEALKITIERMKRMFPNISQVYYWRLRGDKNTSYKMLRRFSLHDPTAIRHLNQHHPFK